MEIKAKSVVFGRMPRKEGDEFKTAFFKIYSKCNPMSPEVMGDFPEDEIEFQNIESIILKDDFIEYYLEGNDIVLDNISSITIDQKESKLFVSVTRP